MRTAMLVWLALGLAGCKEQPGTGCEVDCDTGGDDTADTGDDTADTTDTDTGVAPEPATYDPDEAIVYDLAHPVSWVPLDYSQPVYDDTISGVHISFTLGANVTGTTDISQEVDSHLDRENDGDYVQYFTDVKDGGNLDDTIHINFPMIVQIASYSLDISSLVLDNTIPEANELDWVFPTHIFDTLNLTGDADSTTYVATPIEWTWTSGQLDPGSLAPYVTIDLTADIDFTTTWTTTNYDLRDTSSHAVIATQTHDEDRADVNSYVGELGAEPDSIVFDSKSEGQLENSLAFDIDIAVTLESVVIDPPYTFHIPVTFSLADDATWKIVLSQERITHPKHTP